MYVVALPALDVVKPVARLGCKAAKAKYKELHPAVKGDPWADFQSVRDKDKKAKWPGEKCAQ